MQYFESELFFDEILYQQKSRPVSHPRYEKGADSSANPPAEILGIKVRIGNQPLVYSLKSLSGKSGKTIPAADNLQKEYYLVVHAISAIRTHGKAKVDELQYSAVSIDPVNLQTIDLIPKTRFNEIIHANINLDVTLNLSGEISLNVPEVVNNSLLSEFVDIGPGVQLQLCASADFIGRFTYNLQIPVIQSVGIGSNSCTWILNPDENKTPLLGDQLLIQSISVPRGCEQLTYKLSGLIKADKGIFWKQQEKSTPEYMVEINL